MSARAKAVAVAVGSTVVAGSLLALPAAAQASAKPAPKPAFSLTLGSPGKAVLHPGGASRTLLVRLTNSTGKAEQLDFAFGAVANGAVSLAGQDVRFRFTPVHAPRTEALFAAQMGGYKGWIHPAGKALDAPFTVPAHTTFTWKLTLSASRSWPLNDDRLKVGISAGIPAANRYSSARQDFRVGSGRTGGPVNVRLSGGSTVSTGHPAYETLTLTNRTGARLAASYEQLSTDGNRPQVVRRLAYDLWSGGRWVPLSGGTLHSSSLADGRSVSYRLRVRVVSGSATGRVALRVTGGVDHRWFSWSASKAVTVGA